MVAYNTLFEPLVLIEGVRLRNRVVMAPMTTWASNEDLTVSDEEIAYYKARANGPGLILTGCTHVSPSGIGFTHEFASNDDRFAPGLRRLADAAKSGGATAVLQIFHAGNRALPELTPGGEIVSASATHGEPSPFAPCDVPARALTEDEILAIIADFGAATRRAIEAGFDGIELHGAHGFLIQNFYSPHFNQRLDAWGGDLAGRLRFPLALVAEVRRMIAAYADRPFVVGYRVSPEESVESGLRMADTYRLLDAIIPAGVDYVHISLDSVLDQKPSTGGVKTIAELVVEYVAGHVPVIAAGSVRTPDQAAAALSRGLPLVAVGQGPVMNPDWVQRAQADAAAIKTSLHEGAVRSLAIPKKLWAIIDATTGWFSVIRKPVPAMAAAEDLAL